ncbi:MAG: type VII secretion protein EccB [Pseudonocardia sp.]
MPRPPAEAPAMRAPATRDQADAYRFGLRRLESALVRGDAVPLHEQVRAQRRAAVAGALLGVLALAGVAIFALVSPRPEWTRQAVVVGKQSGSMYVVAHGPDRLVPVANLVAARLVLGALQRGGSGSGDPATAVPVVVPDDALAGAPRTAAAGVAGAEAVRPDAPGIPPRWAVCDQVEAGGSGRVRLTGTTVVAGATPPAAPAPGSGVLLTVPDGSTWLVTGGRRHRIDVADQMVLATLGLAGAVPRPASAALVSAMPEGVRLERPAVAGGGAAGPAGLPERVGDVLMVRPAGGDARPHVVLADGIQPVAPTLAQLLWAARPDPAPALPSTGGTTAPRRSADGAAPREVDATQVAGVAVVERLAVAGWPAAAPSMVGIADAAVVCWAWSGEPGAAPEGLVTTGAAVPMPVDARTMALAQADGPGERLDSVVLGAGGGPVRSVPAGGAAEAGVLFLISETGIAYGVAPGETPRMLGVTVAPPAPEAAVRLLPGGPAVDAADAGRLVDVMEQRVG